MRVIQWLSRHDPGYNALRRAARAAIVMPLLFALGGRVIGSSDVAVFSAFGSFAMLLFVDFSGPLRDRVQAQTALAVAGALLVTLGTLLSQPVWLSALAMAVVALVVLFSGSVSSVTASASTTLLLAFILPVTLPGGSVAAVGPRLLGWGIASVVCIVAITVLWPAPTREPLRGPATEACRALAARLRAESALMRSEGDPEVRAAERERTRREADAAVAALHRSFLTTTYRPTGLSTPARTIVRLVDELNWLKTVIDQLGRHGHVAAADPGPGDAAAWAVKLAAADVLDDGAIVLAQHGADPSALDAALARLADARTDVEAVLLAQAPPPPRGPASPVEEIVTTLDPGFRAQELAYGVAIVGGNIALTARAERRTWWQRLSGRQPGTVSGPVAAAAERATAYAGGNSVWLRNSIRGAIALGLAVLLAKVTGVDHSFWVVLGTLSVLRSNALSTGQTVLRGVLGTVAGVIVGAAALFLIGDNPVVLWIVLPVAILVAGVAPAAISFAAGQAAFTVVLVLLFNLIAPSGWTVGLVRIEDIALGCGVSLLVGALFWPRGATASLRRALSDAYLESVRYLGAAVRHGVGDDPAGTDAGEARAQSMRAAAASRRLDDAFRTYLAERGAKARPLAEVSASATGVAGVRLASDAIMELWRGQPPRDVHTAAAREALTEAFGRLDDWYRELAAGLVAGGPLPEPAPADPSMVRRLAGALLSGDGAEDAEDVPTAVRIMWTADYLEVVARLERGIVAPVRVLRDEATR